MSESHKLSLPTAIMINMNIMLGVGLFVNTITLSKSAGIAGPLIYLLVAVLMTPLVLSISRLLQIHPGGSFYTFGKAEISPFFGFLTAWTYFVSKMASASLMIHFSSSILQNSFQALKSLPPLGLDLIILTIFGLLNTRNMRTGSKIQATFIILKVLPVLFIILSSLIFFNLGQVNTHFDWQSLPLSVPLIIYAFSGFEASCSLSAHIRNAAKNAPRATLIAYFLIACLAALYQLGFFMMMGDQLTSLANYFEIFPAVVQKVFGDGILSNKLKAYLQLAIAISSLGGAYGIIFSNAWNLHILGKHGHLWGSSLISRLNRHGVPLFCLLAEMLIGIIYLTVTRGNPVPLQQIGAFGCTLSYAFCVISLLAYACKKDQKQLLLSILGLGSCIILLTCCVNGFLQNGTLAPFALLALLGVGVLAFLIQVTTTKADQQSEYNQG